MVGIFIPRRNRTGTPDIDDDHQLFDTPLPMIHNIVTFPNNEREDLLKHISDGDTIVVHDELAAKNVPAVTEIWEISITLQSSILSILCGRCWH